jgi:LacI family transcriptional regulator
MLQGITDYLAGQRAGMMFWLGNRTKEEILDHVLGMSFLDGSSSRPTLEDPTVDGLLASSMPTVLIGHRRADRAASYVDVDNEQAADATTTHLISLGRTRVGHIAGSRGTVAGDDRRAGYQRAMRRAGLRIDGLIVDGDFSCEAGVAGASQLLDTGVDAIFCVNDATASGRSRRSARAGGESGRRGPCRFDDLEFALHLDPPLTTARQGVREQGTEAARARCSLSAMRGRSPRRVLLPTERYSAIQRGGVPRE